MNAQTESWRHRHPRLRKALVAFASLAGLVALLIGAVAFWLAHEDKKYTAFLESGASINTFLKAYGAAIQSAVEEGNVEAPLVFYSSDYRSPLRGVWEFADPVTVHGVRHSKLTDTGSKEAFSLEQLKQGLGRYVRGLKSVETTACKINLAEEIRPGESARITVKFVLDGTDDDGLRIQDRFFFRWWLEATDTELQWKVVRDELLIEPEVSNTRVASASPGFQRLDLHAAGVDYVHRRDPNLEPENGARLKFSVVHHVSGGVSACDYDGDGRADILFLDGVQSRLYRNTTITGPVSFADVTSDVGLDGLDRAHGAVFADFDNDGDKDLFVARYDAACRLYRNEGGIFSDHAMEMNIDFTGPSIAATLLDYDRDGYVDIYLAVNGDAVNEVPRIPFFARNGKPNRLFRNAGGKRFEDVTERAGVGDSGWTLAVCAGDLNDDGWTDLGVANDFGRKGIYLNNGDGTFSEVAKRAGTLDFSGGMGIAFGDLNEDGLLDIYTSNIYSNQRWLGQHQAILHYTRNTVRSRWLYKDFGEFWDLYHLTEGNWREVGQMAGEGNSLFVNLGDGTFREARESHTNRAGWGWSVALFDVDNDADLDIYAANGWITGEEKDDL